MEGRFGICHIREPTDVTDGLGEFVCLVEANDDLTRVYFIDDLLVASEVFHQPNHSVGSCGFGWANVNYVLKCSDAGTCKKLFCKGKAGKSGFNLQKQIQNSLKLFLVIVGMWRSY